MFGLLQRIDFLFYHASIRVIGRSKELTDLSDKVKFIATSRYDDESDDKRFDELEKKILSNSSLTNFFKKDKNYIYFGFRQLRRKEWYEDGLKTIVKKNGKDISLCRLSILKDLIYTNLNIIEFEKRTSVEAIDRIDMLRMTIDEVIKGKLSPEAERTKCEYVVKEITSDFWGNNPTIISIGMYFMFYCLSDCYANALDILLQSYDWHSQTYGLDH